MNPHRVIQRAGGVNAASWHFLGGCHEVVVTRQHSGASWDRILPFPAQIKPPLSIHTCISVLFSVIRRILKTSACPEVSNKYRISPFDDIIRRGLFISVADKPISAARCDGARQYTRSGADDKSPRGQLSARDARSTGHFQIINRSAEALLDLSTVPLGSFESSQCPFAVWGVLVSHHDALKSKLRGSDGAKLVLWRGINLAWIADGLNN